jgi:hypothetical protein
LVRRGKSGGRWEQLLINYCVEIVLSTEFGVPGAHLDRLGVDLRIADDIVTYSTVVTIQVTVWL